MIDRTIRTAVTGAFSIDDGNAMRPRLWPSTPSVLTGIARCALEDQLRLE
ncbi:hypothetical protein [Methylobacterium sp. NEAU K]|nr:hypothetical protein [Methylobacterium sp. NEAU K]MDP4002670.1 hypothetical protein [Methylobacterium sp. NEAU K]